MTAMARTKPGWSTFPEHLLAMIAKRLPTRVDVLRFRAVCNTFRSSVPLPNPSLPFPDLHSYHNPRSNHLVRFAIEEYTVYAIEPISEISTETWVVKIKESKSGRVKLLDPFSSIDFKHISELLPKPFNLLDYRVKEVAKEYALAFAEDGTEDEQRRGILNSFLQKAAVFTDDDDDEMTFMALMDSRVVVWRSGSKEWVELDMGYAYPDYVMDCIYHNKMFYVLISNGCALTVDPKTLKVSEAVAPLPRSSARGYKYLAKSSNDLFLISKYWLDKGYKNSSSANYYGRHCRDCVQIFKFGKEKCVWNLMRDGLEDSALFLFGGCNFFLSAKEYNGCKRNCVYLSERVQVEVDDDYPGRDAAIFNLEDGSTECLSAFRGYSKIFWPPPTWLFPKC